MKQLIKDSLIMTGISIIAIVTMLIVSARVKEIDNGSVKVVSENEMAERN